MVRLWKNYSERAWFNGDACGHCAVWEERQLAIRKNEVARAALPI